MNTQQRAVQTATIPDHIGCVCPSCERDSVFQYCGTQMFPKRVAVAAGLPSALYLYTCKLCGTTISYDDNDVAALSA